MEDEIDLADYLKVILKRKWVIFWIFSAFVIAAGVYSYLTPKIYTTETILEIKEIGRAQEKILLLEEPKQIIEKIKNDVYGKLVRSELGIGERDFPKIKGENPKNTNLVIIKAESDNPKRAKNVLQEISKIILKEHQKR